MLGMIVMRFFSVFKRWFGEYVSSVRFENMNRGIVFEGRYSEYVSGLQNVMRWVGEYKRLMEWRALGRTEYFIGQSKGRSNECIYGAF